MNSGPQPPIVVAVDGSERDADALRLGGGVADLLHAPVVVAHAHAYGSVGDLLGEAEHQQVLRSLAERVSDQAGAHLSGGKTVMRLLADPSPARALHRLADDQRAAMIVVGASERGRSASSARAARPSGSSRAAGAPSPPAEAALAHASTLAIAARARLRVISAYEPIAFGHLVPAPTADLASVNEARRAALTRRVNDAVSGIENLEVESVLLDGDAGDALAKHSESLDLLVVGSRGYGPLQSVLLGGVSGHVIRTAACPVLVCPTP